MKFSASTFTALVLIAASAPAHSAPVPLNARGLGSLIEGLVGGPLNDIVSGRRSFSDLSDDEVNTFFEWVNKQDVPKTGKRAVLERSALTDLLKNALSGLTSDALAGVEKLLGDTVAAPAATDAPTATDAAPAATGSAAPISARGIASTLEGILGDGLQSIIKDFVGNLGAAAPTASGAVAARSFLGSVGSSVTNGVLSGVESGIGSGIESILGQIFSRRSFSDLSDDEVNTFFEWVNKQDVPKTAKRDLLERNFLTSAAESVFSGLTSEAISGIEKLFGGGSSAATPAAAPAATAATPSKRGIASTLEGLLGDGLKDIIGTFVGNLGATAPAATGAVGSRSFLDTVEGFAGSAITDIIGTILLRRSFSDLSDDEVNTFFEWVNKQTPKTGKRAFSDLTDDEVNTFFEWVNKQTPKTGKREVLDRSFLTSAAESVFSGLTSEAIAGIEKLFGGGSSAATAAAAATPAARRSLNELD
ncbi:hypothetical protein C8R46DRAFT_1033086 [Mycena filopes]|nr:hypothetical protein C8R46DRAFT_1033086 [Mycena filopes]